MDCTKVCCGIDHFSLSGFIADGGKKKQIQLEILRAVAARFHEKKLLIDFSIKRILFFAGFSSSLSFNCWELVTATDRQTYRPTDGQTMLLIFNLLRYRVLCKISLDK